MINSSVCRSYLLEAMDGVHTSKDEYRMALYKPGAKLDRETTSYSAEGECVGLGYPAGGIKLENMKFSRIGAGLGVKFDDVLIQNCSISAGGCLIYNSSKQNKAVAVFSFQNQVKSVNGKFSVSFPGNWFSIS